VDSLEALQEPSNRGSVLSACGRETQTVRLYAELFPIVVCRIF